MSDVRASSGRRIRFLADQNFRAAIVDGLRRMRPDMDIQSVRDIGLADAPDPVVLAYANEHEHVLLTHDKRTMPMHLDDFLRAAPAGTHHPGGLLIPQRMATGPAIEEILLIWEASEPNEWQDRITFLPIR